MSAPHGSTFPPILSARRVASSAHPFEAAIDGAARGELRATDTLWSDDGGRAELAIVLEPDVGSVASLEIAAVMFLAVADSLGALMPPQTSVILRWPHTLLLNVGEVGRISLALDRDGEERTPDWLVVAASLQVESLADVREPGDVVDRTSLAEEGAGDLTATTLLHAIAAHFLVRLDQWQQGGLDAIERLLAERIEGFDMAVLIRDGADGFIGRVLGVTPGMELRVQPAVGPERKLPFDAALAGSPNAAETPA